MQNVTCSGVVLVLAIGCGASDRGLTWEVEFETGIDASRAARVETRILAGGCGGTAQLYATSVIPGGPTPAMPSVLSPGVFGFDAVAVDDDCIIYARGCEERTLPLPDAETVTVALVATTESLRCTPDRCVMGACDGAPIDAAVGDSPIGDTGVGDSGAGDADVGFPDSGTCSASDLTAQTECGAGLACGVFGTAGDPRYLCYPAGSGGQAALCDDDSNCMRGFSCISASESGGPPRLCAKYCADRAGCPMGPGVTCLPTDFAVGLCTTDCDPTDSSTCPEGTKCDLLETGDLTFCASSGPRNVGESCVAVGDCVPGAICLPDPPVGSRCFLYCDTLGDRCPGGSSCDRGGGARFGVCF